MKESSWRGPEIRASFVRQRRSLIAVSLILFFYQTSGIQIETINVLGNTWPISDPSRISVTLWVAWFYFFIRYYQYFVAIPDKHLVKNFQLRMRRLVPCVASRRFRRNFEPSPELPDICRPYRLVLNTPSIIREEPSRWVLGISGKVSSQLGAIKQDVQVREYELTLRHLFVPIMRAALYVLTTTTSFTEYALPFLVALAPVIELLLRRAL